MVGVAMAAAVSTIVLRTEDQAHRHMTNLLVQTPTTTVAPSAVTSLPRAQQFGSSARPLRTSAAVHTASTQRLAMPETFVSATTPSPSAPQSLLFGSMLLLPLAAAAMWALGHVRRALTPLQTVSVDGPASYAMMSATSEKQAEAKEYIVQCRVYNLDRYGMLKTANKLLQKEVDGIWHVAISVYGSEYWFDHQIEKQDLANVQFARGFAPKYVYGLGTTTMAQDDFETWLKDTMEDQYNINKYECFKHNCHHFANDVANYLTGNSIPQWCISHGEDGLDALAASGANAKLTEMVANKIARIMMVSWGRYEKERFTAWEQGESADNDKLIAASVLPVFTKEDMLAGVEAPEIMANC